MDYSILHGDARSFMPAIPDGSVHLVLTDPPYGISFNVSDFRSRRGKILTKERPECGGKTPAQGRPVANDGQAAADALLAAVLPDIRRVLVPGGALACCCSGGGGKHPQYAKWSDLIDEALAFKQLVVWDKGPMGIGWHYRRSYELVIVALKAGAKCRWFDTSNRVENIIRPKQYGIRKIIPNKSQHPACKPWELAAHFIKCHTQEGDTVLDPFAGHGWVGEACVRLGRKFIGCELDPDYCEVMEKRLERVCPLWAPGLRRAA